MVYDINIESKEFFDKYMCVKGKNLLYAIKNVIYLHHFWSFT